MKPNPNKRTPVTIILGIVCADSIIVASDSQVSQSVLATSKRMDGEKIREVHFADGFGIVANSGSITYGQRIAELTRDACAGEPLKDYRQLADAAEKSFVKVSRKMLEPYKTAKLSSEDIARIRERDDFSLLLANYFRVGKVMQPYLFTLQASQGVANQVKNYVAIGCGAGVAEFLISWFDFSTMSSREAAVTAAFIIGEVKKFDCFCGGPTQIRLLFSGGIMPIMDEAMPMIEEEVENVSRQYKSQWGESASTMIQEIAKKL